MFRFIRKVEFLGQDFIYRRITQMEVNIGRQFQTSFLVKLNQESPIAIGLFQEELKTEQDGISFDQDLSIAESELIDLSQYEIKPGLLVYDDCVKKIFINFEKSQRLSKGIYLGEVIGKLKHLKKIPNNGQLLQLNAEPFLDKVIEKSIQIMFVVSILTFLKQSTYAPERCSEDFIDSNEKLQKFTIIK